MSAKFGSLFTLVVGIVRATSDSSSAGTTVAERASIRFAEEEQRMKHERVASIEKLEHNMTTTAAIHILQQKNATPALLSMVKGLVQDRSGKSHRKKEQQRFLGLSDPKGYSGVDKAREMLNEMLSEVNQKYDLETQRCKAFFNEQCSLMEICRQDISHSNAACAGARERILASQAEINYCERELPRLRFELKTSERVCAEKLASLRADLKVVMDDIAVMTSVLEMTDCDATKAAFQQMPDSAIVTCDCHGRTVASFRHPDLRKKMSMLQSSKLKQQVMSELQMLAEPDAMGMGYTVNVTNFTNDPVPDEPIPGNPCDGIDFDDKSAEAPGGKCSIASNPQCYKLQAKFLAIQAGIEDLRDELLTEIEDTEIECHITQEILKGEIGGLEETLSDEQAKLAAANEEENVYGERGRLKGEEHKTLTTDMFSTRQTCSVNLRTYESEQCALKKIRGEIGKLQGDGGAHYKPFFQDCEVGDWEPEDCSVSCGGGTQKLTRGVIAPPYKGAACPPLEAEQSCAIVTCPVECEMHQWEGWSSCSADCNGGVKQRTRATKVFPKGDVDPCPESSETVSCHNEACDKDCVLAEWSGWSNCSKACGLGHKTRYREILEAAVGQGFCAEWHDPSRMEVATCNDYPCAKPMQKKPMSCFDPVDVILLIDGSASLGQEGWDAAKKFTKTFLSAFDNKAADAQISMIVFGGPKTYSQYKQCSGASTEERTPEFFKNTCGVDKIQDFSPDIKSSIAAVDSLDWPKSTTMLSLALEMAKTEVTLSRSGVKTYIVTVTDGVPLSKLKSKQAMKAILDMGKQDGVTSIVVPVSGTNEDGEKLLDDKDVTWMKTTIASDDEDDNTIAVDGFKMLPEISTIDKIVVDMCQNVGQPMCKNWCAQGTMPWATKCTWAASCGGCAECP